MRHSDSESREWQLRAWELDQLLDSTNRPYVHVVDGGVSDNLGIRAVIDSIRAMRAQGELSRGVDASKVRRVVLISVNAYAKQPKDWDRSETPPGSLKSAAASAGITMDRYSMDTLMLAREEFQKFQQEMAEVSDEPVKFYPIHLSFTQFKDNPSRHFFLSLPTSFFLPTAAVEKLEEAGRNLLDQNSIFQQLIEDLGATRKTAPAITQTGSQ